MNCNKQNYFFEVVCYEGLVAAAAASWISTPYHQTWQLF